MKITETQNNFLVVDFEATCCDKGSVPRNEMEIIEVGAVLVDCHTFRPIDEFQRFIRPVRHPLLTDFCKTLTTINQWDVDSAATFPAVAKELERWLAPHRPVLFCSWGDYDRKQLIQDAEFHRCSNPIGGEHCNVKQRFSDQQGFKRGLGLGMAMKAAQMRFKGTAHRGIDDARNIVRLLPHIFGGVPLGQR
ncbi:3'-5' exonuclease [Parachitinimonas caeni]|uniref:Exonuclease domain-containing protein n=1 Tax=Parachitinimonas caeni TaxID=3031301 RepID=A0ABT7DWI9_9NEIS|nr:3'-5' exonuclease [Parachitinimonas caeni]MDK2124430.1 exonuclease domain-containing protein [Parachitinimonas caeni]